MTGFEIVFWHWFALGVFFLIIEMIIPAFFFLSLTAASLVTGLIVWLMPSTLDTEIQFIIFSVLAILSIIAWWVYGKKLNIESDQPLLNKRGSQYVGRVFNLYEPIENGQGKIKVDDSIWKVQGEDCGIDTKVKVIASRGTVFDVERVD